MSNVWTFISVHQTAVALTAYYIFGALVGGMPAPTVDSSTAYKWAFSSLNLLASNIARAKSTTIENSPNWQAAVDAHIQKAAKQVPSA